MCAERLGSLPAWQRCAVCGRPLTAAARAIGACERAVCREEHLTARPARARVARRAALLAEVDAAHAVALGGAGDAAGDAAPVVIVPGLDASIFPHNVAPRDAPGLRPVPRRRRRARAAHLRRQLAPDAAAPAVAPSSVAPSSVTPSPDAADADPDLVEAPGEGALAGGACAACGGRCCRAGADHAYLTAERLRDGYLAAHPGARARDVVAAYLAFVPAATVAGSCVFHGAAGCGLPRALRSDVCNRYLCEGLVTLRRTLHARAAAGRTPGRAFVAVVAERRVVRAGLVGGSA